MSTSEIELRKTMSQYGKQSFTEKQQIQLLNLMLEDAKIKVNANRRISRLINQIQAKLKNEENLDNAIRIVNELIIELESKDTDKKIIDYLKSRGVYRILYHNPRIKGEELPENDILHKLLRLGFGGVVVSALIIMLFGSLAFFTAPFWVTAIATGLFVGASVYISGILYGVVNDMFATHANLPYFLLGHQPQQKSLLKTNNKFAQGIAWGVAATFGPVIIATVVFTVAALITAFFVPIATYVLPILMFSMPLIAVGAEFYARKQATVYKKSDESFANMGSNNYQRQGLDYMSPTKAERSAWFANSDRNFFGFTKVPLIAVAGLVVLIVLSAVSMFFPPILPVFVVGIPVACAAVACVVLLGSWLYMHLNRNKQLDDRYRLEFDRKQPNPNLYLEKDMDYVNELLKKLPADKPANTDPAPASAKNQGSFFDKKPDSTSKQPVQVVMDNNLVSEPSRLEL